MKTITFKLEDEIWQRLKAAFPCRGERSSVLRTLVFEVLKLKKEGESDQREEADASRCEGENGQRKAG